MQSIRLLEAGSNFREYVDESHLGEEARPRVTPAPALQAGTSVGCVHERLPLVWLARNSSSTVKFPNSIQYLSSNFIL